MTVSLAVVLTMPSLVVLLLAFVCSSETAQGFFIGSSSSTSSRSFFGASRGGRLRTSSSFSSCTCLFYSNSTTADDKHLPQVTDLTDLDIPYFQHGLIDSTSNSNFPSKSSNGGKITMVGAGPGSPDLLTVAAHQLLTQTDDDKKKLIIADRLVSKEILDLCTSGGNELRIARKYPGCAEQAQEEIYQWITDAIKEGKHVIRLKIGDPFVFGRGGEEILRIRSTLGVEPTVIPGVSAAFSAPLLGQIPVTHRGVSNQVVMCTGYGRNGTSPDLIQYHSQQTVVFLMAVGRLQELMNNLITKAGYPSDTPVGIVENAGIPNKQRTLLGDMTTIAELSKLHNIQAPSTIIVGNVVPVLHMQQQQAGAEAQQGITSVQQMSSST